MLCAELMFLKYFCVTFHEWNNFSLGSFSLDFLYLEKKNDVQLTIDGSYECYVCKIDVFQVFLC